MKTRHEKIVEAICEIADDLISDKNYEHNAAWNKWLSHHQSQALKSFQEWRAIAKTTTDHPDVFAALHGQGAFNQEFDLIQSRADYKKREFYRLALPVMIKDTNATQIQSQITTSEKNNSIEGGWIETTHWQKLESDEVLSQEAWAYIGKELTRRLFTSVSYEETKSRGRRRKNKNQKVIFIARQFISLKRALFRPYYELAPFTDLEIAEALLSDRSNPVLRSVLKFIGIDDPRSPERLRNQVSSGRKFLKGYWLAESHADGLPDDDLGDVQFYSESEFEDRIAQAQDFLGVPLTDDDKEAIRMGYVSPTEFGQILEKDGICEDDMETLVSWKLSESQLKNAIEFGKDKFGLTSFKSQIAQRKTKGMW